MEVNPIFLRQVVDQITISRDFVMTENKAENRADRGSNLKGTV